MPRLSAWAVRAALLHLLVGFSLGALLLWNKGLPFGGWVWALLPGHIELLMVGWIAQLILGVAFWILPRYPGGSRGDARLAWAALVLLNAGVLLVAVGLAAWGRGLEFAAAGLFALHAWGRVRKLAP